MESALLQRKEKDDKANETQMITETCGLKSLHCSPQVKEWIQFEGNFLDMIKLLKFRKTRSRFQRRLKEDINTIHSTDTTLTFADKTSSLYKLKKEQYKKMLNDSITTTYKKASDNIHNKINTDGKKLMKDKDILNRMLTNGKNECFITLKDHKPNFKNNPKVRLINPAKNEIFRISKNIVDKINHQLRDSLRINQWKETSEVIEWFLKILVKNRYKFIIFDIKDFYPPISEKLLTNALNFAKEITHISREDIQIMYHARNSLLFSNEKVWMERERNLFDVTMGAYDGAEVCELVGIFMLNKISEKYNKNDVGLYRDDGLAVFKNINGPESERIKKNFQSLFAKYGLEIIIECNKKVEDYLDVTFNLNDGTYKPYQKPDNKITYTNVQSNHPTNIIKQLPKTIEQQLSKNSSNETIFNEAAPLYEKALSEAGYDVKLKYKPNKKTKQKNRKRNMIWYNPPYSKNVITKVGHYFLKSLDKHFPRQHKLHEIFNKHSKSQLQLYK